VAASFVRARQTWKIISPACAAELAAIDERSHRAGAPPCTGISLDEEKVIHAGVIEATAGHEEGDVVHQASQARKTQ
jgi:hypothetical protein